MRDLKERIKQAIDRLEDEDPLIDEIADFLGLEVGEYELSQAELDMVAIAREEITSGKTIPHESVIEEVKNWLQGSGTCINY